MTLPEKPSGAEGKIRDWEHPLGGRTLQAALWACTGMVAAMKRQGSLPGRRRNADASLHSALPKLRAASEQGGTLDLTGDEYECLAGVLSGSAMFVSRAKGSQQSAVAALFPPLWPELIDLQSAFRICKIRAHRARKVKA